MPNRYFPLDNVQQMVRQYRGICTWDFSQGMPVHRIRDIAGNGICMSMACHWIKYHAQNDSLVNKIGGMWIPANPHTGANRHCRPFNEGEFRRLADWQRRLRNFPNWIMGYQNWVRNNQMRILQQHHNVPMSLSPLKRTLRQINGAYALIILGSPQRRESHAVAAYIGGRGEDACFFDPNYGEFWFQRRRKFMEFFHFFSNFIYRRNHTSHMGFDNYHIVRIWNA